FYVIPPCNETGDDRELLCREAQCLLGDLLAHALHLEHDAARLHNGHPVLGCALALAHADLSGFLGDGLVGEDLDPHLTLTLHEACHRDTGRLYLTAGDPAAFQCLDTEAAEGELAATVGKPLHLHLVHL